MKIVGLCQFAVFGPPGRVGLADGRLEVATLEDAHARLWHPVRMAQRFHLLEALLLPALRAQTEPEAEVVMTTSTEMPEIFQVRLERVTAGIPGLRLLRVDGMAPDAPLLAVMEAASGGFAEPVAYYQVGEDQALSADFTARLQASVGRVDPGGMVSFPTGVLGFHDGEMVRHCMVQDLSGPVGLAGVMPPGPPDCAFDLWLGQKAGRVPVFTEPRFAAYCRTVLGSPPVAHAQSLFPVAGYIRRRMAKTVAQHPELVAGEAITGRAAAALTGFPQATAEVLRAAMDPVALAESMGFPPEPLAG